MTLADAAAAIKPKIIAHAQALGFDLAGVADPQDPALTPEITRYQAWIEQGHGAGMAYLSRHAATKANPDAFLPGVRSVIVVGLLYGQPPPDANPDVPQISMYTRGLDYHAVMEERLTVLVAAIAELAPGSSSRIFVDKDQVLDRFWAYRAGLGWVGKNTCLIDRKKGSLFFIGGIMTTAELEPDAPQTEHCGRCTRCIDACPTGALVAPRTLNANLCIGYHTIENKSLVPHDVQDKSSTWIAGCDICQTVCPWNDPLTPQRTFTTANDAFGQSFDALVEWDESKYKTSVHPLALSRVKYGAFLRNLAVAIRNADLTLEKKQQLLERIRSRLDQLTPSPAKDGLEDVLNRQLVK